MSLEWYRATNRLLSVSVSPEAMLYYAALLGDEDPRGSCRFEGEIPKSILYWIGRICTEHGSARSTLDKRGTAEPFGQEVCVEIYETTGTVENQGQVHVGGVPFASGTQVDIMISPKRRSQDHLTPSGDAAITAARGRMRELFGSIKGFRNSPRIPREELSRSKHSEH